MIKYKFTKYFKKNNEPNFINQNNATDFIIKKKSNYIKQINL